MSLSNHTAQISLKVELVRTMTYRAIAISDGNVAYGHEFRVGHGSGRLGPNLGKFVGLSPVFSSVVFMFLLLTAVTTVRWSNTAIFRAYGRCIFGTFRDKAKCYFNVIQ